MQRVTNSNKKLDSGPSSHFDFVSSNSKMLITYNLLMQSFSTN